MVLFVAKLTSKVILKNKLLYTEFNSLKMTPPTLIIDTLGKEEETFYFFFLTTNFMLCMFSTYEEHTVGKKKLCNMEFMHMHCTPILQSGTK